MGDVNRIIFHVDMDAFFTSVEQRDNPQYRGKPVIVGAKPGKRGVVSAASYEARKFGVHSAMPINEAYRRCPHGIFLLPRMDAYIEASQKIMELFGRFSPLVEQISVDEAFIDMTGTEKISGAPVEAANRMGDLIKKEQHLTASIGIAPNKFLSKIASDFNKPDGITLAPFDPEEIIKWLAPMNVGKIWGVGKKSEEALNNIGVSLVSDLQALSLDSLSLLLGKQGVLLYYLCRGIDNRPVGGGTDAKSISREHTFDEDSDNKDEWKHVLFMLCQDVAMRARKHGVKGCTVVLSWRRPDFSRHSSRKTLAQPTDISKTIYEEALLLLGKSGESRLRLVGIGITGLTMEIQTYLFDNQDNLKSFEKSEHVVDLIKDKFGSDSINKGRELAGPSLLKNRPHKKQGANRQAFF
jgi:DNA polymerase-4